MANCILSVAATRPAAHPIQYHLPEADRQAILAQAGPTAAQRTESMRIAFSEKNGGCDFGQNTPKPSN